MSELKLTRLKRRFVYNGIKLADPGIALTPEQVREFHALTYPELSNAVIDDKTADGVVVYSFRKSAGTKG